MKPTAAVAAVTSAVLALASLTPARDSGALASPTASGTQEVAAVNDPYLYTSDLGDFRVMMPSGCSEVRIRHSEKDDFAEEDAVAEDAVAEDVQVVNVFCDRSGQTGSGCSVSVTFNLTDGKSSPAGEPELTKQIQKYLDKFGVEVLKQAKVARKFPQERDAQGMDLRCRAPESPGEVWIRGLLVQGDIYVLVAWNDEGGLWSDPDIVAFFESFVPSAN